MIKIFKKPLIIGTILLTTVLGHAQTDTLKFYVNTIANGVNLDAILHDGESYSTEIPNIQIDIFNATSAEAAANRTQTGSFAYFQNSFLNTTNNYINQLTPQTGIADDGDYNYPRYMVIASNNGSEFYFKGLLVGDYTNGERQLKVEGFKDGGLINTVMLEMPEGVWEMKFDTISFTKEKFGNVDEIRISRGTNDLFIGNLAGFNDFVFSAPATITTSLNTQETETFRIWTDNGAIHVNSVNSNTTVTVYSVAGIALKNTNVESLSTMTFPKGVYLVQLNNTVQKVVIE